MSNLNSFELRIRMSLRNSFAVNRKAACDGGEMSEPPSGAHPLEEQEESPSPALRSTRSHVRGHYRRNYHVASTPDAFQLRGIDEARRDEARRTPSFSPREKPCAAVCVTYRRGYLYGQREGSERTRVSFYLHFSMPL